MDREGLGVPRCIPDVSQVYPRCIPGVSQVYLRCIPGVSQVYPRCISGVSQVYPRCIPGVSRVYLRCIPGVSQLCPAVPSCAQMCTLRSSWRVPSQSGACEKRQPSPLAQSPVVWKSLHGKSRGNVKERNGMGKRGLDPG
ncbi:hypothetical protein DV515_00019496 [Chloebia gouldiae]|uniref:Uncharacterized protein n=1 Tax=Chloebia gouldiae TaxID=44316 RepID=A0A3L8Q5A9_CHLGU|nr:hypothetical protein DV515_00019496 [Chloebia gouldiae]